MARVSEWQRFNEMSASPANSPARAELRPEGDGADVLLAGEWRTTRRRPAWADVAGGAKPAWLRPRSDGVTFWDSSLILFLSDLQRDATARGIRVELDALPAGIRGLVVALDEARSHSQSSDRRVGFLETIGITTGAFYLNFKSILHFVGECVISTARAVRRPRKFRWADCLSEMQQCGAMALPITSLIAFLIGLTFAYQAANTLREFGADIWVADLVGVMMVREMGPMMVAVVLAGRTGAAFAATLGNMKTNEEIDALEVLGIPPVDFLVLPRLIALAVMMPLLVLYANCVAILGGMLVSASVLQIPPAAYWIETRSIVDLTDVTSGLAKATVFGVLIGLSGCLRGLQAERSAAGVGRAATSAVVTAVLFMIIADAVFAVVYNLFGI